jgi:hypothetical protein
MGSLKVDNVNYSSLAHRSTALELIAVRRSRWCRCGTVVDKFVCVASPMSVRSAFRWQSLKASFVGIVAADEKPDNRAIRLDAEGAVVVIDANGPEGADALEVK